MTAVILGLKNGERAKEGSALPKLWARIGGQKKFQLNSDPAQGRGGHGGRDRWISVSSGREGRSEEGKKGWREGRKEEENKLRSL